MSASLKDIFLPPEISPFERQHLEKINRLAMMFFAAHVPVMMVVAFLCETNVLRALVFTLVAIVPAGLASYALKSPRHVSLVFGVAAMSMGGLLVHFGQGPMQIEMHFYFFVVIALLIVFANPMVIILAEATVVAHHLILFFVVPSSVFNYEASLWTVVVHAVFVALETSAACYVARSYFDNVMGLEKIVDARTEELKRMTEEKLRVESAAAEVRVRRARSAGISDAATGVLHNVGNALNSVGVAASMIGDKLRKSKLPGLAKANGLLKANAADLPTFLQSAQGKQLPGYLDKLGGQLQVERDEALAELDGLQKGIAHMTAIVNAQQSLAKVGSATPYTEDVKPAVLFEDALAMALPPKERAALMLTKDFCDDGPMPLDRHRLVQILVNMIQNAAHALEGIDGEHRVALKVGEVEGKMRFQVVDNGVGIDPENKVKIFSHGFTTKANGHGFGLHACACAAMEMGGTLGCDSPGLGHGATFYVDVPIKKDDQQLEAA